MQFLSRLTGIFILVVVLSCGGSKDPLPEEEEQVENPIATTLVFPHNNTECQEGTIISNTQSKVVFRWDASENTDSYEVHLEDLDNGTEFIHESNSTELEITLERGTAYRWSVISKSLLSVETAQSEVWKFYNAGAAVVNHAPFPADIISPSNNSKVSPSSGSTILRWEGADIDNDIDSYQIFLGTSNPPTQNIGTTSATEMSASVMLNNTYYWYIITSDGSNNTSKSDIFSFSTQ